MELAEMAERAREIKRLRHQAEELKKSIEALEGILKEEMMARETETLICEELKLSYKTVSSMRLDTKALKAEQPQLYQRYAQAVETHRFTIT